VERKIRRIEDAPEYLVAIDAELSRRSLPATIGTFLLLACLVCFSPLMAEQPQYFAVFTICVLFMLAGRYLLFSYGMLLRNRDRKLWKRVWFAVMIASGLLWGGFIAVIAYLEGPSSWSFQILLFGLSGLCGAASASICTHPKVLGSFYGGIISPQIIVALVLRQSELTGIVFMFILFCVFMLAQAGEHRRTCLQSIEANLLLQDKASQLEQANEAKSTFLANMSHELRTPLNAIIGYSEMLMEEAKEDQPAYLPDLERIHSAGVHQLSLVNDILDLSRIEAGRMELSEEKYFMRETILDVISIVRPMADRNGNALVFDVVQDPGEVMGDSRRVKQIVLNILSNACKFTANGTVAISLQATPQAIEIIIADSGIGIQPEALQRLFQPFAQASQEVTRKFGGSGLGLALSREFTHLMGGEISAASVLGKGSAFTITLPRQPALQKVKQTPAVTA
jgi:signal transduction histidine kinase